MGRVHLTFDNGPHPEGTPAVLEVLARRGLSASFFVLGKELSTPVGMDLARRIRDEGHRLGNHSFSHETPLGVDPRPDAVEQELDRTQALLDTVWEGPLWFRPFGGGGKLGPHLLSPATVDWLVARKATCVLWSSVPGDWLNADGWPTRALQDADEQEHDVLVLHDILPDAMRHLDAFLGELTDRGHTFTDALPDPCVPIRDGSVSPGIDRFVSTTEAST